MSKVRLEIEDLNSKLGANVGKKLGDLSLPVEIFSGSLKKDLPIKAEGVTFSLSGAAGIYGFNSVDDKDPLGVIGPAAELDEFKLGPQIEIKPGSAWLKYQAQAGAKAAAGLDKSGFGFSLDAEGGVLVASYRVHKSTETVGKAAQDDLASPRLIFSKKHIKALDRGEAVALKSHGKLSAGVELKWADVFSSSLSAFGKLLDAGEAFAIKVDAGVTASFNVSLEDEFLLVFSRVATGRIRVAIKKSDKKSLTAAVAAKIGAQFANPKAVEQVLGNVLDGLLGEPLKTVEALVNKASFESLSVNQKAIAERLLDRFGIDNPEDKLTALRKKLVELKKDAAAVIKKVAETRVELGFSYEYSRVTTTSVLLQATLQDASLDAHHGKLIRGRIAGLLDAGLTPGSGVRLEKYLHERTKKIRHAWGMGLSAGKWFSISGLDFKQLTEVVRTTADGRQQISFDGARGYEGKFVGDISEWQVDFNATMPKFSSTQNPTANEFDYSLFLSMSLTDKKVKSKATSKDVARLLDLAIVWGAITFGGSPEEEARLKGLLKDRRATFSYQLKLDDIAFRDLLPVLAAKPTDRFAAALGETMPWHDEFGLPRQQASLRRSLYGGLWKRYFDDPSMTPSALARLSQDHLKRQGHVGLAHFEGRLWRKHKPFAVAGLAEQNSKTRDRWDRFSAGIRSLKGAIDQARPYEKIKESYRDIGPLFAQAHWVKGLGALLLDLLRARPELLSHVERICTVEYTEGGKKKVENISTT